VDMDDNLNQHLFKVRSDKPLCPPCLFDHLASVACSVPNVFHLESCAGGCPAARCFTRI
jgi:hypothetical protein